MVAAGQAIAASSVLGGSSPAVATVRSSSNNAAVAVAALRKQQQQPFATVDIASFSLSAFPLGKRLRRRSCLRVSALQQQSAKSSKWVLDPCGKPSSNTSTTFRLHTYSDLDVGLLEAPITATIPITIENMLVALRHPFIPTYIHTAVSMPGTLK